MDHLRVSTITSILKISDDINLKKSINLFLLQIILHLLNMEQQINHEDFQKNVKKKKKKN